VNVKELSVGNLPAYKKNWSMSKKSELSSLTLLLNKKKRKTWFNNLPKVGVPEEAEAVVVVVVAVVKDAPEEV
jgi:negative regulator of sigma E activity